MLKGYSKGEKSKGTGGPFGREEDSMQYEGFDARRDAAHRLAIVMAMMGWLTAGCVDGPAQASETAVGARAGHHRPSHEPGGRVSAGVWLMIRGARNAWAFNCCFRSPGGLGLGARRRTLSISGVFIFALKLLRELGGLHRT